MVFERLSPRPTVAGAVVDVVSVLRSVAVTFWGARPELEPQAETAAASPQATAQARIFGGPPENMTTAG